MLCQFKGTTWAYDDLTVKIGQFWSHFGPHLVNEVKVIEKD